MSSAQHVRCGVVGLVGPPPERMAEEAVKS